MLVRLAYSLEPRRVQQVVLRLPEGATVLQALVAAGRPLYTALAVFAVLISVVGAFYYLRVIKLMYFDEAAEDTPIAAQPDMQALLALNGVLLLFYGILPGGLLTLCSEAVLRMLQH